MKPASFSPRTFFIAVSAAVFLLAIMGWSLWSVAAMRYRTTIDGWIEQNRAAGYQISYDDRQVFGFPRHIVMRLTNLRWKSVDGVDFRADKLDLSATPWLWTSFDVRLKGNASLSVPGGSETRTFLLSAQNGRAQVELSSDGTWRSVKMALNDARSGLAPDSIFRADRLDLSASRPAAAPADHTQPGLSLAAKADGVTLPDTLPRPFGARLDRSSVSLRVMGAVPSLRDKAQIAAWNDASGVVEFDDLSLSWGALDLTSKGTVGLDEDLQPQGAFAGTIANPDKVMDTLKDQGFVEARDAGMLASAMKLFARPAGRGDKGGMEFPITVQLGGLFFGPVRLLTFPEIDWPEATAAARAN